MKIAIDMDGTLCTWHPGRYEQARPLPGRPEVVRRLAEQGHEIWIYTARGSGTHGEKAEEHWGEVTRKQLAEWDIPYKKLLFGKPPFDLLIDDRAIPLESDWIVEAARRTPDPDALLGGSGTERA